MEFIYKINSLLGKQSRTVKDLKFVLHYHYLNLDVQTDLRTKAKPYTPIHSTWLFFIAY